MKANRDSSSVMRKLFDSDLVLIDLGTPPAYGRPWLRRATACRKVFPLNLILQYYTH